VNDAVSYYTKTLPTTVTENPDNNAVVEGIADDAVALCTNLVLRPSSVKDGKDYSGVGTVTFQDWMTALKNQTIKSDEEGCLPPSQGGVANPCKTKTPPQFCVRACGYAYGSELEKTC
jgi:hypothetical protein